METLRGDEIGQGCGKAIGLAGPQGYVPVSTAVSAACALKTLVGKVEHRPQGVYSPAEGLATGLATQALPLLTLARSTGRGDALAGD